MTREDFYTKYGDVYVNFDSYYKFTFTYKSKLEDGSIITIDVGGNSDDIYRFNVYADEPETIKSLQPYSGVVSFEGKEVDSFYDY